MNLLASLVVLFGLAFGANTHKVGTIDIEKVGTIDIEKVGTIDLEKVGTIDIERQFNK